MKPLHPHGDSFLESFLWILNASDNFQRLSLRSPGGGNGNSLQYSCLEDSMERGALRATASGVPKSQTWPSGRMRVHARARVSTPTYTHTLSLILIRRCWVCASNKTFHILTVGVLAVIILTTTLSRNTVDGLDQLLNVFLPILKRNNSCSCVHLYSILIFSMIENSS